MSFAPGVYPASVTPFDAKGAVDGPGVARLLAYFRANGCKGVVVAGTNGEGPSLSAVEKRDLAKTAVSVAEGLDVILGIATSSSDEALWLCKQCAAVGANAALVMPPAYFREASEEGVALWYEELLDKSPTPILAYNLPQRTGITLSAELVHRLGKHERLAGVKDSSGNPDNLLAYAQAMNGMGKSLFVGDETLLAEALDNGWTGTISGAANALPNWLSQIVAEWQNDPEGARIKHELILPALTELRKWPQPMTNKALVVHAGVMDSKAPRLPLLAYEGELPPETLALM